MVIVLLLVGFLVFVGVQAYQLKNTKLHPSEVYISLEEENPYIKLGGRIETPKNINGVYLKGYDCKIYHELEGDLGLVKSLNSQVINHGWFHTDPNSLTEFETSFEMTDANYETWNKLVFNRLLYGIDFLHFMDVKCTISLEITLSGIPISYDHQIEVNHLDRYISLDFLETKN